MRERADMYRTLGPLATWEESELPAAKERLGTRRTSSKEERARETSFVERVVRAVGNGAVSKACQMLVSDGVLDARSEEVMQKLRDLHPPEDLPPLENKEGREKFVFGDDDE